MGNESTLCQFHLYDHFQKPCLDNLPRLLSQSKQIQNYYPKLLEPAYFSHGPKFAFGRWEEPSTSQSVITTGLWADDWQERGLWTVTSDGLAFSLASFKSHSQVTELTSHEN